MINLNHDEANRIIRSHLTSPRQIEEVNSRATTMRDEGYSFGLDVDREVWTLYGIPSEGEPVCLISDIYTDGIRPLLELE